jgi:DNA-binding response OmpR family regulator
VRGTLSRSVLLVEDDVVLARAWARPIHQHGWQMRVAHTLSDARAIVEKNAGHIDDALLDVRLPDGVGTDLIPILRAAAPQVRIAVISAHLGAREMIALQAQRVWVVSKPVLLAHLLHLLVALDRAPAGLALQPVAALASRFELSVREMETLVGVLAGKSRAELATDFACSVNSVNTYVRRICAKCGCRTLDDLMKVLLRELSGEPSGADRHTN